MKITHNQGSQISRDDLVRVKQCGAITEIMHSEHISKGGYIRKVDGNTYVDIRDGTVGEFKHHETRADDLQNVAKSLSRGRDLINTNVTDPANVRWITLTYRDNMTDPVKLANDFKHFNTRLRKIVGDYEYITCAEPQARGAWHLHVLQIFPGKAPYIANDVVANAWKQGFVNVQAVDDVDNVGAYLTAYLADIDITEDPEAGALRASDVKEIQGKDDHGNPVTKRIIKGGRLHMYPAGFHIFRASKGIKEPQITYSKYHEAKEKVSGATLTFSRTINLDDDTSGYENTISYEYYNSRRPKCQGRKEVST